MPDQTLTLLEVLLAASSHASVHEQAHQAHPGLALHCLEDVVDLALVVRENTQVHYFLKRHVSIKLKLTHQSKDPLLLNIAALQKRPHHLERLLCEVVGRLDIALSDQLPALFDELFGNVDVHSRAQCKQVLQVLQSRLALGPVRRKPGQNGCHLMASGVLLVGSAVDSHEYLLTPHEAQPRLDQVAVDFLTELVQRYGLDLPQLSQPLLPLLPRYQLLSYEH